MDVRKQPEIRFRGFEGDWEEKKIGDVGIIITGKTPPTNISSLYGDEIMFVTPTDIDKNVTYNTRRYLSIEGIKYSNSVPAGSILVTCIASIGKNTMVKESVTFNQQINAIIPHENFNSYYLLTSSAHWSEKMKKIAPASTMQIVNKSDFSNLRTLLPSQPEQEKIGTLFETLDALIEQQESFVEENKRLKKAMFQKMFPKKGQKVPDIRLQGFSGDWEEKKLGEITDIRMGQSPDSKNYTNNPNDFILVQGNADLKQGRVVPRIYTTEKTKISHKNDIIMTVRAPVGEVAINEYDVVLGRGVAALEGNEFLYQYLQKMNSENFWKTYSSGSTFESVNSKDIKAASIYSPSLPEQEAIGRFFKTLDEKIEQEEQKLDQYKSLKKALLQKMFV